jgi:cytochrome o ubiquinol oxidase subunit 1
MTRRLQHIADPSWRPWLLVAGAGAVVIFCGVLCQIAQLYISIRTRERRRDVTGDPWNGRTLEWATPSPPPAYNFAVLPRVETIDAFWEMKRRGRQSAVDATYEPIHMPRNSATGFVTAIFAVMTGFALIWHIWWMVILGLLAAAATILVFGWSDDREREVVATEVARLERSRVGFGGTA